MIQLPSLFQASIGKGKRTALYPLVRIYKNVRIDDQDSWADAKHINLCTKDVSFMVNDELVHFKPILLSAPSIKSDCDLIRNKYKISKLTLIYPMLLIKE